MRKRKTEAGKLNALETQRNEYLWALRDAIQMLDDLRLDYRRRFAIEEQTWLRPRIKRLDEIRKIAGLP